MTDDRTRNRYLGCLVGLAVGDAIGTTVEFAERGSFSPLTDMVGGGPFDLEPGQWTDDTSMALCLAHSLLHCQGFDAIDQMNRYCNWYQHGYMSSTGECFDIGHTTVSALRSYLWNGDPMAGSTHPRAAGNGGIMRLAPIPMYYAHNMNDVIHYAAESSKTTHAAPEAFECAMLLGSQLASALNGEPKQTILSKAVFKPSCEKVDAIMCRKNLDKSINQINGTGYVIDSLEAALYCFAHTTTFSEAVLMAANLGDDADTTAAVTGQLAGAFYGFENIPARWINMLSHSTDILNLADKLYQVRQKFAT